MTLLATIVRFKLAMADMQPMPDIVTFTREQLEAMHERNRPIIEEFGRLFAIDAWRRRFNDPRNNPFA